MKLNPVTVFVLYFHGVIFAILLSEFRYFLIFVPVFIFLLTLHKSQLKKWGQTVKPFIIYLPILGLTFVGVSFFFTEMSWGNIAHSFGLATLRLWLMISMMAFYLISQNRIYFIPALRSIRFQLGLKGKWSENLLLFIEMIFRFSPGIQMEWNQIFRGKKALGFSEPQTRFEKIKMFSGVLPYFLHNSLLQSEQMTRVMKLRGYGKQFPRGVYPFHPLKSIDFIVFILLILFNGLFQFYGTL